MTIERPTRRHRLLVVDADPALGAVAAKVFEGERYDTRIVDRGDTALRQIETWCPDAVLLEHRLADSTGIELLPRITALDRHLPVVLVTSAVHSSMTIAATGRGAFDCLAKPIDAELLKLTVQRAMESRRLLRSPVVVRSRDADGPSDEPLIGQCPEMRQVYKVIGRIAAHDASVLITGETGTGKQLAARAIHTHSRRADRPMQSFDCGNYEPQELDTELFGSPDSPGAGLIHECAGGTIVLRDIGAIGPATQGRLLHLIRQRTTASGEAHPHTPAIVFSTAEEIEPMLAGRRLRRDLFYELCANQIHLPPLRRRRQDIRLLVEYFSARLSRIHESFGECPARVSDEAMRMLEQHVWPGNVTELKSVLRRLHMENLGTVVAGDFLRQFIKTALPAASVQGAIGEYESNAADRMQPTAPAGVPVEKWGTDWPDRVRSIQHQESPNLYAVALEQMERGLVTEVLACTGGNLARSARLLGITRVSLRKKIHLLGIEIPGRGNESTES